MISVHLKYENDRGMLPPERDSKGSGRFWSIIIDYKSDVPTPVFKAWEDKVKGRKFTKLEAEDAACDLAERLGIKDSTSDEQWRFHGVEITYDSPSGFVNWPDGDLG